MSLILQTVLTEVLSILKKKKREKKSTVFVTPSWLKSGLHQLWDFFFYHTIKLPSKNKLYKMSLNLPCQGRTLHPSLEYTSK